MDPEIHDAPQAIQGRWQAYGQMRAAKTTGGFALFTTGIFGLGLWGYQQTLSRERKELDKSKEGLTEREVTLQKQDEARLALYYSCSALNNQLKVADKTVLEICNSDPDDPRYKAYQSAKDEAKDEGFNEAEENIHKAKVEFYPKGLLR
jgi:hypothetical protein